MLQSDRLIFEVPQTNDFERFYKINSDPENNLFNPRGLMNFETANEGFNRLITHWTEYNFGSWAIKVINSSTVIGFGGLSYMMYGNELKLNLGYRFDKTYWGQGYATELSKYAIDFGFYKIQKDKIFALVRPQHSVSIRVLEKCNMKLFGDLNDVPDAANSLVYVIEKSDSSNHENLLTNTAGT